MVSDLSWKIGQHHRCTFDLGICNVQRLSRESSHFEKWILMEIDSNASVNRKWRETTQGKKLLPFFKYEYYINI